MIPKEKRCKLFVEKDTELAEHTNNCFCGRRIPLRKRTDYSFTLKIRNSGLFYYMNWIYNYMNMPQRTKGEMRMNIQYHPIDVEILKQKIQELFESKEWKKIVTLELLNGNIDLYHKYKSWRTNSLEGNTTNLEQYQKIKEADLKTETKLLANTYGEQYEIRNIITVYESLIMDVKKLKQTDIQQINFLLGEDIYTDDFLACRGRFKTVNNFVPHRVGEDFVKVTFCPAEDVKEELQKLLDVVRFFYKHPLNFTKSFILAMIFQLEFTRIHPFNDGNGRTSRIIAEKIMEANGYAPFIVTKDKTRKVFKEMLFQTDTENNTQEQKHEYNKYLEELYNIYIHELTYMEENREELLL